MASRTKTAFVPMSPEASDKQIAKHEEEVKTAQRQIKDLREAVSRPAAKRCGCGGDVMITRSLSGLWRPDGAYRLHTLDCSST